MRRSEPSARLWLAVGLSPVLHLVAGAAIVSLGDRAVPARAFAEDDVRSGRLVEAEDPVQPDSPRVQLGIDRSKAATITWIGFETATEHEAPESETQQSALTRDAPSPPAQVPGVATARTELDHIRDLAAEPHASRTPDPAVSAVAADPLDEGEARERQQVQVGGLRVEANEPDGVSVPVAEELVSRLLPVLMQLTRAAELQEVREPTSSRPEPSRAEQPAANQPEKVPPASAAAAALPRPEAIRSEREADPSAWVKPVTVRPGQVVAAEGLEIQTRRIELTTLTQVVAGTVRVNVLATFDRSGLVSKVEFVRRSGHRGVDEPVLNSVYGWRAKGRVLEQLPAGDPNAGVTIPFEIVVR